MSVLKPTIERDVAGKPFRILDIGAGTGVLTLRLLEYLASHGTLAVVDYVEPSEAAMRVLEDRIETAGFGQTLGDHYGLGWEDAKELICSARKGYDLILAHPCF